MKFSFSSLVMAEAVLLLSALTGTTASPVDFAQPVRRNAAEEPAIKPDSGEFPVLGNPTSCRPEKYNLPGNVAGQVNDNMPKFWCKYCKPLAMVPDVEGRDFSQEANKCLYTPFGGSENLDEVAKRFQEDVGGRHMDVPLDAFKEGWCDACRFYINPRSYQMREHVQPQVGGPKRNGPRGCAQAPH